MINLDDLNELKKLDPKDTITSTQLLPEQFEGAWKQIKTLQLQKLSDIDKVVFCGMGASIYGGLVVRAVLGPVFPHPVEIVTDYHLPDYVNESTLVVLTSYSGTTEEVLSCAHEALGKKAKMAVLTQGGELAEFAKKNSAPAYIFDGKLNPSGVPRLGNGYSILGLIGLLYKTGVISVNEKEIEDGVSLLVKQVENIREIAKKDAQALVGKTPVVIAAEHLAGNAQIMRNQFNETSKTFSAHFLIPDLNHHLMEGLQFPTPTNLVFMFLDSNLYSAKIAKRVALTKEVIKQNQHEIIESRSSSQNKYSDFMEAALYSSYVTLFLGLLYEQNPAVNPWVDYFKEQLKK